MKISKNYIRVGPIQILIVDLDRRSKFYCFFGSAIHFPDFWIWIWIADPKNLDRSNSKSNPNLVNLVTGNDVLNGLANGNGNGNGNNGNHNGNILVQIFNVEENYEDSTPDHKIDETTTGFETWTPGPTEVTIWSSPYVQTAGPTADTTTWM